MSAGEPLRLANAHRVAVELVGELADACVRIEIAGSIRRRRDVVHDIEIVAISGVGSSEPHDLWGEVSTSWFLLDRRVEELIAAGTLAPRAVEIHRRDGSMELAERMGSAYKALVYHDMPVDLFVTDAVRWGCIYALRTGPGDWNRQLVTGCKELFRRVEDGRVLYHNRAVPTPEEADFFRALGVPWVEPEERTLERLRFDPAIAMGAS